MERLSYNEWMVYIYKYLKTQSENKKNKNGQ